MSERLDRIEGILEQVAQQQQTNTEAIAQLTVRVDNLTVSVEELTNQGDALVEAVSGAFAEMRDDRQVFQAEIRRIWEYLLAQSGNGRSPN